MTDNPDEHTSPARGNDPVPDQIGPLLLMNALGLLAACTVAILLYWYGLEICGYVLNHLFSDMSREIDRYLTP